MKASSRKAVIPFAGAPCDHDFTPDQFANTSSSSPTPMTLLSIAVAQGADLDRLERLMALQERWEANEARRAFTAAMVLFKEHPPVIVKNRQTDYETRAGDKVRYKYAGLDEVSRVIGDALAVVGIAHRWDVIQQENRVTVACILTHKLGHCEVTQMTAPPDLSGGKDAIKAIASTITHLEKYTLMAAAGVAAQEDEAPPTSGLDESLFEGYLKSIRASKTIEELHKAYTAAYRAAASNKSIQQAIIRAKDEMKKALQAVA